jgi:hypothetical protein
LLLKEKKVNQMRPHYQPNKKMKKYLVALLGIFAFLFSISLLQAYSPPSDWWGTVQINGEYSNEAVVYAYIDDVLVASTIVGAIQPNYYLIHVPGKNGDLIQFKINGRYTENDLQIWVLGSNELDLVMNISLEKLEDDISLTYLSSHRPKQHCEPSWKCSTWSSCESGIMKRECYDANHCSYSYNQPNGITSCEMEAKVFVGKESNSNNVFYLMGILTLVTLLVSLIVLARR